MKKLIISLVLFSMVLFLGFGGNRTRYKEIVKPGYNQKIIVVMSDNNEGFLSVILTNNKRIQIMFYIPDVNFGDDGTLLKYKFDNKDAKIIEVLIDSGNDLLLEKTDIFTFNISLLKNKRLIVIILGEDSSTYTYVFQLSDFRSFFMKHFMQEKDKEK